MSGNSTDEGQFSLDDSSSQDTPLTLETRTVSIPFDVREREGLHPHYSEKQFTLTLCIFQSPTYPSRFDNISFSRLLISFLRVQRAQSVDGTRVGEGNSREISRSITPTHSPFPRAVWKIERARKAVWRKGGGGKKMHKRGAKRPG